MGIGHELSMGGAGGWGRRRKSFQGTRKQRFQSLLFFFSFFFFAFLFLSERGEIGCGSITVCSADAEDPSPICVCRFKGGEELAFREENQHSAAEPSASLSL